MNRFLTKSWKFLNLTQQPRFKTKKAVVKNNDDAIFHLFEDEGDELLDVYPGDEYYQE